MNIRWQTLILILLILISFSLTKANLFSAQKNPRFNAGIVSVESSPKLPAVLNFAYPKTSLSAVNQVEIKKGPVRNWNVLDPKISAEAVMIQSLDENFPFLNYNTYKTWPIASLTKLLTAVLVVEEVGLDKKIMISERAVASEGEAGNLKSGEIYTSQDLLKIMLLSSSNDAATAFEDYFGGNEAFLKLINQKAAKLGMTQTIFHDGSGLSDLNRSTASDLFRFIKYILEHEPQIFNWTRLERFLVQPINESNTETIYNINPLVSNSAFWGGKTGTSEEARENLIAIFSLGDYRMAMVILGSPNRVKEAETLLEWAKKAYDL